MADDDKRDDDRQDDDQQDDQQDDRRDDDQHDDRNATDRERALAREAANYRRRLRDTEKERDDLKRSQQSDAEKAVEDARKEEREKVQAEYRTKLIASDVRAAAAGMLEDPADAARYLDLEELAELSDAERPAAITKALEELVETKPYLGVDGQQNGDRDARPTPGARSTPAPGDRGRATDPDAWIRKGAGR